MHCETIEEIRALVLPATPLRLQIVALILIALLGYSRVASAQSCPGGLNGTIILESEDRDAGCNHLCQMEYSFCTSPANIGQDVLGGTAVCDAEFNACLCACPFPIGLDTGNPGPACPGGCSPGSPTEGEPVDAFSGLFLYDHTDLQLKDVMPVELSRSYRQLDQQSRAFGIGMALGYDMQIVTDQSTNTITVNGTQYAHPNYAWADLILPNGRRVHYIRISAGWYWQGAQYQNTNFPGEYFGSILTATFNGWVLRLKDGAEMSFLDSGSMLTLITDRNGNKVHIFRDPTNPYATAVTSPNGRWTSFTYDSSNRIIGAQDNAGRTVSYQYDSSGRLKQYTDANGGITKYAYNSAGLMYTISDPRGNVVTTNQQYDSNNRVLQQTDADNFNYYFSYPSAGVTEYTDPNQYVRHTEFNSNGFLTKDVLAQGKPEQQTTTYNRDPNTNLVQSKTDALNRTTAYTYDALGNTTSVTQLAGTSNPAVASYHYDPNFSQLTSITDPLGHTWVISLDGYGNPETITDPLGHHTTENHNSEGELTSYSDGLGETTHFGYTSGDLTSIADPLGNTSYFYLDAVGRTIWTQDPLGSHTNLSYSPLDDLTQTMDEDGNLTRFGHDPNSNLTSVTDANGHTTSYGYDPMNRKYQRTDPLGAIESYGYDGNGNMTGHTDRRNKTTVYQFDGLNRRKFGGYGFTGTSYESTSSFQFDAGDRIMQIVDSLAGTTSRQYSNGTPAYDGLDDLLQETTQQGTVNWSYDSGRRRQSMTVAGQPTLNYCWDNANRLTGITQGSCPNNPTVGFGYDNADRRTTLTLPNGIVLAYTYDNASRVTAMNWTLGSSALGNLQYQYDADGRVAQKSSTGSFASTQLPSPVINDQFNAANEMISFNGTALTYDANGNLTNDGTNTYTWDARNHLVGISGGNSASFVYDADGRRALKSISGTSTQFLYDGLNPVQEIQNNAPSANMLTGLGIDEFFQRTDSSGSHDYLSDILGSTMALTNTSGSIQTQYTYQPFGNSSSTGTASANPYQFSGRENDGTGLYNYRVRYYSPTMQKFIAEDPLNAEFSTELPVEHSFKSNVERSHTRSATATGNFNLYEYSLDDPINRKDAMGLAETAGQSCSEGDPALLKECQEACAEGGESWEDFCRSLPEPRLRAGCWALQFAGTAMCMGWCYWQFGD